MGVFVGQATASSAGFRVGDLVGVSVGACEAVAVCTAADVVAFAGAIVGVGGLG